MRNREFERWWYARLWPDHLKFRLQPSYSEIAQIAFEAGQAAEIERTTKGGVMERPDPAYLATLTDKTRDYILAMVRMELEVLRLQAIVDKLLKTFDGVSVERLRNALQPFIDVAKGIPDNWPVGCSLIFVEDATMRAWHLGYAGVLSGCPYPTIRQYREAAEAAKETDNV